MLKEMHEPMDSNIATSTIQIGGLDQKEGRKLIGKTN